MFHIKTLSSSFCGVWLVFIEQISHIIAIKHTAAKSRPGIIPFTYTALFSLHSNIPSVIEPSPASRPTSVDLRSETSSGPPPKSQMDLLPPLSSSTLGPIAGGLRCRESKLDPRPSCGGR
jgi:hypothetical protein